MKDDGQIMVERKTYYFLSSSFLTFLLRHLWQNCNPLHTMIMAPNALPKNQHLTFPVKEITRFF